MVADDTNLYVYDPISRKSLVTVENTHSKIKQAVWYNNLVALVGRKSITLLTKTLAPVAVIEERLKIKSVIWLGSDDTNGFVVYSTKA